MFTALAAQNWGLIVLRGVFAILLGILALVSPGPTLAALILVFAVYAFVDGIFAAGAGFAAPNGPRWWLVVGGALGIVLGAYTLFNPQITAVAFVIVIGAFAVVRGVAEVATAISLRDVIESAWIYILSGIVGIVFGAFLLVAPPATGVLTVLWLIAYYSILAGVTYVAIGLRLRGIDKTLETASTSAGAAS
jgi:uncharacterized membrane protein HdeD (DUF308 family)